MFSLDDISMVGERSLDKEGDVHVESKGCELLSFVLILQGG